MPESYRGDCIHVRPDSPSTSGGQKYHHVHFTAGEAEVQRRGATCVQAVPPGSGPEGLKHTGGSEAGLTAPFCAPKLGLETTAPPRRWKNSLHTKEDGKLSLPEAHASRGAGMPGACVQGRAPSGSMKARKTAGFPRPEPRPFCQSRGQVQPRGTAGILVCGLLGSDPRT